ncbi:fimbrial protein [Stenotrophomonas cyclobalanopsidis]|uniref:Fimbrial protein n=2 Tax=Stenotrophomonas cyclobalanopsidis TaxID=2771362 RepID=A0ABQ6T5E0_9GAMM|nr:fimbrial protein [Stenotrophomonas cyclobalanopsidis]
MSLPDVRPTALPTAGSTAGNSTLNVRMNCPSAGTTVKLTLTDANGNSGGTGQLTPTRDSTAAGARVRLLRGTTPVQFGTQWTHGASSAGDQSIAFTAQYIRTSGALQPGVLRGEATLTADYQ